VSKKGRAQPWVLALAGVLGILVWVNASSWFGGADPVGPQPDAGTSEEPAAAVVLPSGPHVAGVVHLTGPRPEPKLLTVKRDPAHAGAWTVRKPWDERFEVSDDGTLPHVVVWVSKGLPADESPEPDPGRAARITIRNHFFVPHVVTIRAGDAVEFTNTDTHRFPVATTSHRNGSPSRIVNPGELQSIEFAFAEERVHFRDDLHPWMSAWAFVFDHRHHTVTDSSGGFVIPDLAPGDYTFKAWHEEFGETEFAVVVPESGKATVEVTLGKE